MSDWKPALHGEDHLFGGADPTRQRGQLSVIFAIQTTGVKCDIPIMFPCRILAWSIEALESGSVQFDIWKDVRANFPPTDADSITGGDEPAVSSDTDAYSAALSNWTTLLAEGDVLRFNVDSVSGIQHCTLTLQLER